LPKIVYCTHCNDKEVELDFVGAKPSSYEKNYFLTFYKCPRCGLTHYDAEYINTQKELK